MISLTLSSLRKSPQLFQIDEIATIINGRKREEIGYFVPKKYEKELREFIENLEKNKKKKILKKILEASRQDPIGDGGVDDGIA